MTLDQLKAEVVSLGFDTTTNIDSHIVAAANRALRHLYNQRSITRTARLFARGPAIAYYAKEAHSSNGKEFTLPAPGIAYSMRVCGSGYYCVVDGTTNEVSRFETGPESQLIRGFLTWGGNIRFWGGLSFSVYDYTVYSEIFSPYQKDIPSGGRTVAFDLREIYGDFFSFLSPAIDTLGEPIPNCLLHDGRIEVDSKYRGEIIITYRRLPTPIEEKTEIIDIPEEYTHLFPLLVASYVWLDTDSSKAKYYKERYDEMIGLVKSESYQSIDTGYQIKDGWA